MASVPDPYSFSDLLAMSRSELRVRLVKVIEQLATMHEHVAFIRATSTVASERYEYEGHRDALIEEKWLVMKLMEDADG